MAIFTWCISPRRPLKVSYIGKGNFLVMKIDGALTRISLSCGKFCVKLDMWNCIVSGFFVVINGKHDFNFWLYTCLSLRERSMSC